MPPHSLIFHQKSTVTTKMNPPGRFSPSPLAQTSVRWVRFVSLKKTEKKFNAGTKCPIPWFSEQFWPLVLRVYVWQRHSRRKLFVFLYFSSWTHCKISWPSSLKIWCSSVTIKVLWRTLDDAPRSLIYHQKSTQNSARANPVSFARATIDMLLRRTNEYVGRLCSSMGGHAIAAYRLLGLCYTFWAHPWSYMLSSWSTKKLIIEKDTHALIYSVVGCRIMLL